MPQYEYICENEECAEHERLVVRLARFSKRDQITCKECGEIICRQEVPTKAHGRHISWSLWSV